MAITAAIIGGLSGIGTGLLGGAAANDAANDASALQLQGYLEGRRQLSPYAAFGQQGLYSLGELMGVTGYRTPEEMAYNEFLSKGFETPDYMTKQPNWQAGGLPSYWENGGNVDDYLAGLRAFSPQTKRQLERYSNDLKEWDAKRLEMLNKRDASLAEYDPMKVLMRTPGYQTRYQAGLDSVMNNQQARGMDQSGRALKELTQYGQNFAANEYQNEIARRSGIANTGYQASGSLANLASGQAANQGNIAMNAGNATADMYGNINSAIQGSLANYAYLRGKGQGGGQKDPFAGVSNVDYSAPSAWGLDWSN